MTVVSMVRKQSDRRGWLWRRSSEREPWTKVFASVKGSQLSVFRDEKVSQPIEVISLTGATVQEATIDSGKPPGRTSRSISLQIPSQEIEELQSLLPQCAALTFAGNSRLCQVAAPDVGDHTQWLKLLKQGSGQSALPNGYMAESDKGSNRKHGERQTNALEPSVAVSTYLCSPAATSGPKLFTGLQQARRGLQDGAMNLGTAREEARQVQFALNGIRRALREIDLSITHSHRDREQEGGGAAAGEVRDWLEQALMLMHDIDTRLETLQVKDAPLATDWGSFARETGFKLHVMEEALQLGQYVYQARRDMREDAQETGGGKEESAAQDARKPRVIAPYNHAASPYRHYKHKLAM